MKKTLLFKSIALGLFMLLGIGVVSAQNLLLNGDLESWTDATTPTSWTKVENITQESTIVHGGASSAQHIGGTKDFGQTIVVEPNSYYTIVIWYYVEAGDGTDARIWSFFQDADDVRLDDIDALLGPDNGYFASDASWQKFETTVASPADAASLYFEVRTYSTATVYWDDMSVTKVPPPPMEVTFNVDMNAVSSFIPGTDVVYIAGDIAGGWVAPGDDAAYEMTDADSDGIYTITLAQDAVGNIAYKYFINAGWDGGEWTGGDDRTATITETTTLNNVFGKNIYNVAITETGPYNAGDDVTITWSSVGVSDVTIDAWAPDESEWYKMFETTPSDGSEVFTIPADAASGNGYYLRISDLADSTNVFGVSTTFEVIGAATVVTIAEIQTPTDILVSDASPLVGQNVIATGIVTAFYDNGYFIQDADGAWNGVLVMDVTNVVAVQDEVTITAEVVENYSNTQLENVTAFNINSNFQTLPAATVISTLDANNEDFEGVLVSVENAENIVATANYGEWTIDDGTGAVKTDDLLFVHTLIQNSVYNITGVMYYSFSEAKLLPRDAADITLVSGVGIDDLSSSELNIYPNPSNGKFFVQMGSAFKANTKVEVYNVIGMKVFETLTNDFKTEINLSAMKQGVYFVKVDDGANIYTQKVIKQ